MISGWNAITVYSNIIIDIQAVSKIDEQNLGAGNARPIMKKSCNSFS